MNCSNETKNWIQNRTDEIAVEKHGCYFDLEAAEHFRNFTKTYLRHVKGPLAGQPYEILDWHWKDIIAPVFGWMMPDGTRRHNAFDCFVPKKNAKSTLAGSINLYMLAADGEPGAEVYSAAGDRKQASIVFDVAKSMLQSSPELMKVMKIRASRKLIMFPSTDSKYEVLTADGTRNEGYDIHCCGIDELHTQRNRALWGALRYGGASRRQPLFYTISTAGEYDEESLWWERFNIARNWAEGKSEDIHYRGIVYAIRDDEDWKDPEVWKRCNPGWGVTINPRSFENDYKGACQNAANESEFLRYHLNRATKSESGWLRRQYWVNCLTTWKPSSLQVATKTKVFLGVDIADSIDINASVQIEPTVHPEKQEIIYAKPYFYCPEDAGKTVNKGNRERYEKWWSDGHLRQVKGAIVTPNMMAKRVFNQIQFIEKSKKYEVVEVGVDKFHGVQFMTTLRLMLSKIGHKCVVTPVSYNYANMNEPLRYLESLITSAKLMIPDHPVMNWMFNNVKVNSDSSGNRKLDKSTEQSGAYKIDGFAALTIALYVWMHYQLKEAEKKKSKYNQPGTSLGTVRLWGTSDDESDSES